jgi:deoxyribodipyrimidine photo-lyase
MLQLVWYKRDLRVRDHRPLAEAVARGPVLPLYVAEPAIATGEDFSPRHWSLIAQGLHALRQSLAALGQPLVVRCGRLPDVFETLYRQIGPFRIWTHQETGNRRTFNRDLRVHSWAQTRRIPLTEYPCRGVVRPLRDRDTWSDRWEAFMRQPPVPAPEALMPAPGDLELGCIPTHADLGLAPNTTAVQALSETHAHQLLDTFLHQRGKPYRKRMSSPRTAERSCSRLSVHFVYGTLSIRQAVHALRARQLELEDASFRGAATWRKSLSSFDSRLHWHGHFMQKLEDAPRIEHESYIPAFDSLRADDFDPALYEAWKHGQTGFPMVDACMRYLRHTGWLNFRMRAMLCSFAAYDCWLDWRRFAPWYGGQMADYEPGIHYPQVQMQSGTTGINRLRIYNPVKQGHEHDPKAVFIRRWVPELSAIENDALVHEPWQMSAFEQQAYGCVVGRDYPERVVDHLEAYHHARNQIETLREKPHIKKQADAIVEKHGSRRRQR